MNVPARPSYPPVNVEKLLAAVRRAALAAPLAALDDWWLHVSCSGCGWSTSCPLRLMVERHGRGSLAEAVNRLSCKRCRKPPASVKLTDDPTAGAVGAIPPTWRVELLYETN